MTTKKNHFLRLVVIAFVLQVGCLHHTLANQASNQSLKDTPQGPSDIVDNIIIEGLTLLPEDTILSKIPYEKGDFFDPHPTSLSIKKIYDLGYFKQVHFATKKTSPGIIDLHVILEEKTPIKEIVFEGNKVIATKDLKKKLGDLIAAEPRELTKYALALERYYSEKNCHFAKIKTALKIDVDGKGIAIFTICEGPVALVKKVRFIGNKHVSGKRLRSLLFTREDWILSVLDRSGTYNPLAIEQDRDTIEQFYQSNGYLHAKVPKADINFNEKKKDITVTFTIQEGAQYTISSVKAPGNDIITEAQLLDRIPLRPGMLYSKELLRFSIEQLRNLWGAKGYIYADIDPSIEPDEDNKTVAITFYSHPGDTVHVNRINIFGNEKSRDKIIRRQLVIEEGDLLTTEGMEASKNRVAQLGYFDPKDGVNWKINRLDNETADIDLLVKEIKTGRFEWKTSFGGSPTRLDSPNTGVSAEISMTDRNLAGKGYFSQVVGRISAEEKAFTLSLADPWFCDKPIRVGIDAFLNHSTYDELKKTTKTVGEKQLGSSVNLGFASKTLDNTLFLFDLGFQNINYLGTPPQASISSNPIDRAEYQLILDERFLGGKFAFLQSAIKRNTLNHHIHVTEGYKWDLTSKFAIPILDDVVGFFKFEADAHWYTSLIGDYQLVFHSHFHGGIITEMGYRKRIPYRELYSIGGPASVRAWRFGQISPLWFTNDLVVDQDWQGESIGGKKAVFVNLELVFPITNNLSIKGCVFYDGGAGWDTPNANTIRVGHLKNNSFDYRHCIGIGIRLLEPQPMRVEWGFKLDKRDGEPLSEVQFSGYYDF